MRILVTGSRDWTDRTGISRSILREINVVCPMIYDGHVPLYRDTSEVVIVHGAARGADRLTDEWAKGCNQPIKTEPYPVTRADWRANPRVAGYMRNQHMVKLGADVCIGFLMPCRKVDCERPDVHYSHGASHTVDIAELAGIRTIRVTR